MANAAAATVHEPARRLRVCHIAYTFYENDNRVIRYAEALAARGAEVEVLALRRPGQARHETYGQVRLDRLQKRTVTETRAIEYFLKIVWFLIQSAILITARHARRRYDLVHVHNVPDFLVFAALVPKLTGARIILDIHDILPELYAGKFNSSRQTVIFKALLAVERASCRFADHVIVANHLWYNELIGRSVDAARCTTIMNYPDLRLFKPLTRVPAAPDDRFVFLYPGTLNHHQGVDVAIHAIKIAREYIPSAELHIYGEGPAKAELLTLTAQLGLVDWVRISDRMPLVEIARVMATADVGVVPKRADGFGNQAFSTKILEFMACGVPVIVSRTQIDTHYFDDRYVRFFESGDPTDLAQKMIAAYRERDHSEPRINAGRAFAIENSWQSRVETYLQLVDGLAVRRPIAA